MSDSQELQVTPLAEWQRMRLQGVRLTLPTERKVRMRAVDPSHFVRDPAFEACTWPGIFNQLIVDMFWRGDYPAAIEKFLVPRESLQEAADVLTSLGIVAQKALLEPALVDVPQTDDDEAEIAISDLQIPELVWIFRLAFMRHEVLYWLEEHGLAGLNEDTKPAETVADA